MNVPHNSPTRGKNTSDVSRGGTQEAIRQILQRIAFLSDYSATEIFDVLADSTKFYRCRSGYRLLEQGQEPTHIFYIVHGSARITRTRPNVDGTPVTVIDRVADEDTLVGRYALVYNLPCTSTVEAITDMLALKIPTSALERLLYRFPEIRPNIVPQKTINRLRTVPLFKSIGLVTLSYLAEDVTTEHAEKDQLLYTDDQHASYLYLIDKGQVVLYHPRRASDQLWLGTGAGLGYPGRLAPTSDPEHVHFVASESNKYGHWATVTTETTLYRLPWETIHRAAGRFPELADAEMQNRPMQTLENVSVFAQFTATQRRKLAGFCSFQHIPQHHLIMQQGDIGDSMWILLEGSKATLSALDQHDIALPRTPVDGVVYFGEGALHAARHVRSTVEAEPGSLWLRLHRQDFRIFLEEENELLATRLQTQRGEDDRDSTVSTRNYRWLGDGEVAIDIKRRHWIALLPKLRFAILATIVGFLLTLTASLIGIGIQLASVLTALIVTLSLLWGIIDYWNDYFIITNQRIIQQEKVVLTNEYRREAMLEQIERVDVQTSFWGNLLKYGTLSIYTAGTTGSIEFDLVSEPHNLKATIFQERRLRYMRYRAESKLEIQNALEQRLGLNVELPGRVRASATSAPALNEERRWWQKLEDYITGEQGDWQSSQHIVWRKHWLILVRNIAAPCILFLLLIAAMLSPLIPYSGGALEGVRLFIVGTGQVLFGVELLLACFVLGLFGWIVFLTVDWWNDTYELTNDRIMDVERLPFLLSEERREASLSQIQDVTYTISSPIEMLFDYGSVKVQTAAAEGAFTFDNVPSPRQVKDEINRRLVEWRRHEEMRKTKDRIRDLPDWFELYNRLEAGLEPSRLAREDENPLRPSNSA